MIPPRAKAARAIWANQIEMQSWLGRGLRPFLSEVKRRSRLLDPPEAFDIERTRLSMSMHLDAMPWDNFERLRLPSYFNAGGNVLRYDARADWFGVDERLRGFAGVFLHVMQKRDVPFYVHTAFRGQRAQDAAQANRLSHKRWPNGPHNKGAAIDVIHGRYHWDLTRREWSIVGDIGKQIWSDMMDRLPPDRRCDLVWGGDWRNPWDPAHWELGHYRSLIVPPGAADLDRREELTFTRDNLLSFAPGRRVAHYSDAQAGIGDIPWF